MKYNTATPYIASYVLLKKDGKYAFVLRANTGWMDGHYGLPAGKVERGESFAQAAVREAKEEVGIDVKPENLKQVLTCHRKEHDEELSWVDIVFEATSWEGEAFNAEPQVHDKLDWFALDNLPENFVPSLRFMLEQVRAGKTYCECGWKNEQE